MEFTIVRIKELEQFARSWQNRYGDSIPITPWRGESQVFNPYANPNDVALIYAVDHRGELLGFIGAMPASHKKSNERYVWNSGWWVKPGIGATVSLGLLNVFLKEYGFRVMFSDIAERTVRIIKALGIAEIKERHGILIWLRLDINRKVSSRRSLPKWIMIFFRYGGPSLLIKVADFLANLIVFPFHFLLARKMARGDIEVRKIFYPEADDLQFIKECAQSDVFYPDMEDLKWYSEHPWLIRRDKKNSKVGERYHFSSFANRNQLFWLRVVSQNQTRGLVMLSLREGVVKTQFVYASKGYEEITSSQTLAFILRKGMHKEIISYSNDFVKVLKNKNIPCFKRKVVKRYYGVSKNLTSFTGIDFTMQDGSGDYIFT